MVRSIKNRVFRDNIQDNRLIPTPAGIRAIIDTRPFQRLRNIRQMGLSSLVFPTAEHSRFAHSVGVFATAQQAFATLQTKAAQMTLEVPAMEFDEDTGRAFCAAAICHDLGHTAYSHVLEGVLLPEGFERHEECSLEMLLSDSDLQDAVMDYTEDLESVLLFIQGKHPNIALTKLISGPFDVDRSDYLLRDSQGAGVHYGKYDVSWLLHSMMLGTNVLHQPILVLDGPRGMDALRQFLSSRRYMFRHVYLHAGIRCAQLLLKSIFERISEYGVDRRLLIRAPSSLRNLLKGSAITIDDFVRTTDIEVNYLIRLCAEISKDEILRSLCEMFMARQIPKCLIDTTKFHVPLEQCLGIHPERPDQLPLFDSQPSSDTEILERCRAIVGDAYLRDGKPADLARYTVFHDRKPFDPEPLDELHLSFHGRNIPFHEVLHEQAGYNGIRMMESFELYRLFVPPEYADDVSEALGIDL